MSDGYIFNSFIIHLIIFFQYFGNDFDRYVTAKCVLAIVILSIYNLIAIQGEVETLGFLRMIAWSRWKLVPKFCASCVGVLLE